MSKDPWWQQLFSHLGLIDEIPMAQRKEIFDMHYQNSVPESVPKHVQSSRPAPFGLAPPEDTKMRAPGPNKRTEEEGHLELLSDAEEG